jgi:hypothetical protein
MKPGATQADMELHDWMSRQWFEKLTHEVHRRNADIVWQYNPKDFAEPEYSEKGFLSCVIAGARIPASITAYHFVSKKHQIIFYALKGLESLGLVDLRRRSLYAKLKLLTAYLSKTGELAAAGGEKYLYQIENLIGIPSAVNYYTEKLREFYVRREYARSHI